MARSTETSWRLSFSDPSRVISALVVVGGACAVLVSVVNSVFIAVPMFTAVAASPILALWLGLNRRHNNAPTTRQWLVPSTIGAAILVGWIVFGTSVAISTESGPVTTWLPDSAFAVNSFSLELLFWTHIIAIAATGWLIPKQHSERVSTIARLSGSGVLLTYLLQHLYTKGLTGPFGSWPAVILGAISFTGLVIAHLTQWPGFFWLNPSKKTEQIAPAD